MSGKEKICPKCKGNKTGFFERYNNISICQECEGKGSVPIPDVFVKVKQLTLEELREQFEKFYNIKKDVYYDKNFKCYVWAKYSDNWRVWQLCARANKVLKEGE